ncbi:MAG: hypothetical protein Q4D26_11025 [Clostridia bacterium]|nr:hypothetical protein [Clostridia bacterium]
MKKKFLTLVIAIFIFASGYGAAKITPFRIVQHKGYYQSGLVYDEDGAIYKYNGTTTVLNGKKIYIDYDTRYTSNRSDDIVLRIQTLD